MSQSANEIQKLIAQLLSAPVEDVPATPVPQRIYGFDGAHWTPIVDHHNSAHTAPTASFKRLRLITWNIDELAPGSMLRMKAALEHVRSLVEKSIEPVIIFFQEMSDNDLGQITKASWIRDQFCITDPDSRAWTKPKFGPSYGTTTLISKCLSVSSNAFRVLVPSRFSRDALFIDLKLGDKKLRFCNVHLESLVANPPVRPSQVALAAGFMHAPGIYASVLAGDLNAIEPFDRKLHTDNGLKDAYLELGGKEDSEQGYTWGQQAPKALRDRFGCSRMDKAWYCGGIKALSLERIGEGIEVDDSEKEVILQAGGETFASDHLGLSVLFEVTESMG